MKKIRWTFAALIGAAALAVGTAGPGAALSPSEADCLAMGGTPDRVRGEVICVLEEEGKNPHFTETTTTSGQGNIDNKTETDTECDGTGSGKCPPGQFN
jgi:hypothetical protein